MEPPPNPGHLSVEAAHEMLAERVHKAADAFGNAVATAEAAGLIVDIEIERLGVSDRRGNRELTQAIHTRVSKPL